MQSEDDQRSEPGEGPASTEVEPSHSVEPEQPQHNGDVAVPLGKPVGAEQWHELKRRADEPDHSDEQTRPVSED